MPEHLYSTQNLYEASFLLCRGCKLAGKKSEGHKARILFYGNNASDEALKYYNGGKIEAKAYSDAYRTLKDYIFER